MACSLPIDWNVVVAGYTDLGAWRKLIFGVPCIVQENGADLMDDWRKLRLDNDG